jgi:hypothetical protein
MQSILGFLVIVALIATVASLAVGLIGMARGRDFNEKYGNIIMRSRIISQLATVLLLVAYFVVKQP